MGTSCIQKGIYLISYLSLKKMMQQLDTPTLSPQSMSFWTSDYKKKKKDFFHQDGSKWYYEVERKRLYQCERSSR